MADRGAVQRRIREAVKRGGWTTTDLVVIGMVWTALFVTVATCVWVLTK